MNEQLDRLYTLLPYIYQRRDAEMGYPLRDLLRVIAEQVNLVEGDIASSTTTGSSRPARSGPMPYIGDLVGYRLVPEVGEPGDPHAPPAGKRPDPAPRGRQHHPLPAAQGHAAAAGGAGRAVAGWHAQAEEIGLAWSPA